MAPQRTSRLCLPLISAILSRTSSFSLNRNFSSIKQSVVKQQATPNLLSLEESLKLHDLQADTSRNVRFIDGTWYHKGEMNGKDQFLEGPRIAGGSYFDMNEIACHKVLFPELNPLGIYMMQPPPKLLEAWMDSNNIEESDHLIVYGREGSFFAPRVWFTLKLLGHTNVSIMQGSLEEWIEKGGSVDLEPKDTLPSAIDLSLTKETTYSASLGSATVDSDYMLNLFKEKADAVLIDARGSSFKRSGHMPGAIHIPYSTLSHPESSVRLLPTEKLREMFQEKGVDPQTERPIICTCGSGVSACTLYLALMECGRKPSQETYVYDGSWAEWKTLPQAPKVLP